MVVAADRQATHGALGAMTVAQPVTKIAMLEGKVLFATSGPRGLGQQLTSVVENRAGQLANQKYHSSIKKVQTDIRAVLEPAFQTAGMAAGVMGQAAANEALCGSLLAANFKDGVKLVEFSPTGGVESSDDELVFVSVGSGKQCADTFLGFLKDIFGQDGFPTIKAATLAAYWTIMHAIKMKILGVGYNADVFVLEASSPEYIARQLSDDELLEHQGFMTEAENNLRTLVGSLSGEGDYEGTPPPKMDG